VTANFAEILLAPGGASDLFVGGGNGEAPNTWPPNGFAAIYWFDPSKLTDDDYGQVNPYYVTYFFVNHEAEMALQVGLGRKLFKGWNAFISGVGMLKIIPYAASLLNPYPFSPLQPLPAAPTYDLGDGINVSTERCAFKIMSLPLPGQTDNSFNLQKFIAEFRKDPVSPSRFGAI
jgi:hypothetical protein